MNRAHTRAHTGTQGPRPKTSVARASSSASASTDIRGRIAPGPTCDCNPSSGTAAASRLTESQRRSRCTGLMELCACAHRSAAQSSVRRAGAPARRGRGLLTLSPFPARQHPLAARSGLAVELARAACEPSWSPRAGRARRRRAPAPARPPRLAFGRLRPGRRSPALP